MLSFLSQPYPARDLRYSRAILQALLSGSLIAFILVVFQPFGSYNWQHPYKNYLLAGYGLVAVVGNLTDFVVTQKLFKAYFAEGNWQVWKEIVRNMAGFVLAGFLCVVYGNLAIFMPFSAAQVGYMITVCFMVGALPATVLVLLNYAYLTRKYSQSVTAAAVQPMPDVVQDGMLELVAENGKDKLTIPAGELLYLSASDNYCTVVYTEATSVRKALLRSSLSRLESQISEQHVVRCHRSYLANLNRVASVSGNAQGYKLHFDVPSEPVPVSRAYNSVVKEHMLVC
ncbi:LytTR family DNA-binding domain-containing protein [Pontibacter indicus]|uniref:Transcriptional regulator, LytTR family n=1 Tax=Pontibacter indicus TaxID=1317125 RepID=A0A1R3XCI5_9BACT|nr:LytTR family DNA-binding domain-containing protein [Pontibacter indicus]SIT88350.1 transcriptional regulator, LytTR family [Pontibacter indicus]